MKSSLTKEEALDVIKKMQQHIDALERAELELRKPRFDKLPTHGDDDWKIDGKWAFTTQPAGGELMPAAQILKTHPVLFLANCLGTWYDQDGNKLPQNGQYLWFIPKNG